MTKKELSELIKQATQEQYTLRLMRQYAKADLLTHKIKLLKKKIKGLI